MKPKTEPKTECYQWTEGLAIGDEVAVGSEPNCLDIGLVTHKTRTHVAVDSKRYRRDSGGAWGLRGARLIWPVTDDVRRQVAERREARERELIEKMAKADRLERRRPLAQHVVNTAWNTHFDDAPDAVERLERALDALLGGSESVPTKST